MRIGSDEIILWLRKNNKLESNSNEIIGKKIRDFIHEKFGVDPSEYNQESYWKNKNIDAFNLPKTAAQYDLDFNHITELYKEISSW